VNRGSDGSPGAGGGPLSGAVPTARQRSVMLLPYWPGLRSEPALIVSASTLCASIGLLLRHEWARIAFIGILVLGILWNIGGIVLQQWLMSSMLDFQNVRAPPPELAATMQGMMIAIRVFSALFAIGVSVLFGWIIQKLRSPEIAAEFG